MNPSPGWWPSGIPVLPAGRRAPTTVLGVESEFFGLGLDRLEKVGSMGQCDARAAFDGQCLHQIGLFGVGLLVFLPHAGWSYGHSLGVDGIEVSIEFAQCCIDHGANRAQGNLAEYPGLASCRSFFSLPYRQADEFQQPVRQAGCVGVVPSLPLAVPLQIP